MIEGTSDDDGAGLLVRPVRDDELNQRWPSRRGGCGATYHSKRISYKSEEAISASELGVGGDWLTDGVKAGRL